MLDCSIFITTEWIPQHTSTSKRERNH